VNIAKQLIESAVNELMEEYNLDEGPLADRTKAAASEKYPDAADKDLEDAGIESEKEEAAPEKEDPNIKILKELIQILSQKDPSVIATELKTDAKKEQFDKIQNAIEALGGLEKIMSDPNLEAKPKKLLQQFAQALAQAPDQETSKEVERWFANNDPDGAFLKLLDDKEKEAFSTLFSILLKGKVISEDSFIDTIDNSPIDRMKFLVALRDVGGPAAEIIKNALIKPETAKAFIAMMKYSKGEATPAEKPEDAAEIEELSDEVKKIVEELNAAKIALQPQQIKVIQSIYNTIKEYASTLQEVGDLPQVRDPGDLPQVKKEPSGEMAKDVLLGFIFNIIQDEDKSVELFKKIQPDIRQEFKKILSNSAAQDILKKGFEGISSKQPQDPEKKKSPASLGATKPENIDAVEGLVEALDEFMGQPPGSEPNFSFPESNLLKDQGVMLMGLFSKIRILLGMPTIEAHKALLAINRRNTGPDQESPGKPAPEQDTSKPESSPPAPKRDDIYEAKELAPNEVEPKNLVILRDYIKEAITTVQIYLETAKEGKKGSEELYSKYGNVLGQDAWDPKKVLYQINLKNIINLCNAFITHLDTIMKKADVEEEPLQEAQAVPFAQIVKEVESVFNFVVEQGTQLKKMIADHAVETKGDEKPAAKRDALYEAEEDKNIADPAVRASQAASLASFDVQLVEPQVDAIRKTGQAIHDQLDSIKQHFPLVNPFDSDLYGTKGFEDAINKLKSLLKDIVNISGQISSAQSFAEVTPAAKKVLYDTLERIVKNIKDTFTGGFDKRPAVNNETDSKDFEDKAPQIGGDEAETEDPGEEGTEDDELSQYLTQEEKFYKRILGIRDQFRKDGLKGMDIEEAAIKDPIKYLGDLRIKIEEYEAKLKEDDIKADKFTFRQAMKVYEQYLERYITVYEQFKEGNLEVSFAQTPEEIAGVWLNEKQLEFLKGVMEEYANFHEAVTQFNLSVKGGKPSAQTVGRIMDVLQVAGGKAGKVTTLPAVVTSAEKENRTTKATQERQKERALKSKKNIASLFVSGGVSALKRIITPANIFAAAAGVAGGIKAAKALGAFEEAQEEPTDPDVADDLLDDPEMEKAAEDYEALEGIGKEFADKMQEFDMNYQLGEHFKENIVSYSKEIKSKLGVIQTHAKLIRRQARELASFISENSDQIRNSLIKVAKIKLPGFNPENVADMQDEPKGLPGETAIEVKYKRVLDKYDGPQRVALETLLNKLQELGEEMLQEHKWLAEMIERELDLIQEVSSFPPRPTTGPHSASQDIKQRSAETGKTSDKGRQTTMRTKSGEEFEELPMTDVGPGGKKAPPRAKTLEELVTAVLGKGNFDKLKQGKHKLTDQQISMLTDMFNKDDKLTKEILKISKKSARRYPDDRVDRSEERFEAAKAIAKASEIMSVDSLVKSTGWEQKWARQTLDRLEDEGIVGPYNKEKGGFPVIKTSKDEPEEEFIQGEEPSAADLAAAGPNKPVRVASPRRKIPTSEALMEKLIPIIKDMMRGSNG